MSQATITNQNVLAKTPIHPTIAVADIDAAKSFYGDVLGLELVDEAGDGGLRFSAGGDTFVHVYPRPGFTPPENTVASFAAEELDTTMDALRGNGVTFEEYDLPGMKTENGVVTMGDLRGCWFKDPAGNTIGLFEG